MREIAANIKSGQFHKAYLLYGPEVYLRAQMKEKLVKALVAPDETINFTRFAGKETDEGSVLAQAETMPFFADRRVILVEDSGFFKNKTEDLADYLERIPPYLILIFSESEVDKRTKTFKAIQKAGHVVEFAEQNEETLTRWVLTRMKKEGKKITQADMQHFLQKTGSEMSRIDNELEKLLSYCAKKEVITRRDIDAVCSTQLSNQIFDMVRLVTEHRQKEALDHYYDLLALKEKPMRILYLIGRQYQQLLQIGGLSREGVPQSEIASTVGVPPFVVRKTLGLASRYDEAELQTILNELTSLEEDVKTGRLEETLSVELAIVKLSA